MILMLFVAGPGLAREPAHAYAYFGEAKYPKGFEHFDYVNPDAPKGGVVRVGAIGTFNNLNPFVDKGILALYTDPRIFSLTHEPLMASSEDELATYYGRLAETIEVAEDYRWVEYSLDERATWHDGKPVTVEDILWTFDVYKKRASAGWRNAYSDVERIEKTGSSSFKFHFAESAEKSSHLIILTASFTPLAKHYYKDHQVDSTTLEPPLGNGPYMVTEVKPGFEIVFTRVPNYWARDLNFNRGTHNFDQIRLIYFMDENVMIQALKAGEFDWHFEQNEKAFHTAYDFVHRRSGIFKAETHILGQSYGMHFAVVLNSRRELFQDIRVREALTLAYNFEWANRVFWHNGLRRNNSYFVRSGLQALGLPSKEELAILEPFRDQVPERVFIQPPELPKNNPFGRDRGALRKADRLLNEAGWVIRDLRRVNAETGELFDFEFVVSMPHFEQMLTPYKENLQRLGIETKIRKVENTLMANRLRYYDYDATIRKIYTFDRPLPDRLRAQFSSSYVDQPNLINYPGIRNPVVDFLVEKIAHASSEEEMTNAGRALDRVLFWNFYVIPDGHPLGRHLCYWDRFGHPALGAEHMRFHGFPNLWWVDDKKSARVNAGIAQVEYGSTLSR